MADNMSTAGTGGAGGLLVPDFDRLPVTDLRNRIRSLTAAQLHQLLDHERRHGQRQAVLDLLQDRIDLLRTHPAS